MLNFPSLNNIRERVLIAAFAFFVFAVLNINAQTTEFTYQGQLQDASAPAAGNYDFEFLLFDALSGGNQVGSTLAKPGIAVANGIFSVKLDFGSNFPGASRFLEIHVRQSGGGAFTPLTPRQSITSAPYSVKSLTADSSASSATATNASAADALSAACNGCVNSTKIASGQVVKSVNTLKDDVTLAPGSNITITPAGNTLTIASTSGGVGGSGTPNTIPLFTGGTTLGNSLITQSSGKVGIGTATPTDTLTVQTASNSYGIMHTDGIVTIGSYIGAGSGGFGGWFGTRSLHPLFFYTNGGSAQMTLTPGGNVGIGTSNPLGRLTISGIGGLTGLSGARFDIVNSIFNGGFYQWVSDNGYWTLATSNDVNRIVVTPNGNVGIGTANANDKLTVQTATSSYGLTQSDGNITVGTFVGGQGGWYGTKSNHPLFFFTNNGNAQMTLTTAGNVGIGTLTPQARLHVNGTSLFNGTSSFTGTGWFQGDTTPLSAAAGRGAGVGMNGAGGYLFAYDYATSTALPLNLNGPGGAVNIYGKVTISNALDVSNDLSLFINGGGTTPLCRNSDRVISTCSSSLRYKTNLAPYNRGLDIIDRLLPITFDWKKGGMHDLGFGAEDVATVDPLLVTYNDKGQIEGVKYDRMSVLFVNAFKEQQAQIETQAKQIEKQSSINKKQETEINELRALVCRSHRSAAVCRAGGSK